MFIQQVTCWMIRASKRWGRLALLQSKRFVAGTMYRPISSPVQERRQSPKMVWFESVGMPAGSRIRQKHVWDIGWSSFNACFPWTNGAQDAPRSLLTASELFSIKGIVRGRCKDTLLTPSKPNSFMHASSKSGIDQPFQDLHLSNDCHSKGNLILTTKASRRDPIIGFTKSEQTRKEIETLLLPTMVDGAWSGRPLTMGGL